MNPISRVVSDLLFLALLYKKDLTIAIARSLTFALQKKMSAFSCALQIGDGVHGAEFLVGILRVT